jgi:hypothetical protein
MQYPCLDGIQLNRTDEDERDQSPEGNLAQRSFHLQPIDILNHLQDEIVFNADECSNALTVSCTILQKNSSSLSMRMTINAK